MNSPETFQTYSEPIVSISMVQLSVDVVHLPIMRMRLVEHFAMNIDA
jgi:hypothetical protein